MALLKEFREFAMKGNVVDMAVGIIIGAAFQGIVSSLVNDIIMPLVGKVVGGVDFKGLKLTLGGELGIVPELTLNYGKFLQQVFDFTIVAFAMFMLIKAMNAVRKKDAPPPPPPPKQELLLAEIRDLLKVKSA